MRRLPPLLLCLLALAACRTPPAEDPVAVGPPSEEPREYADSVVGIYEGTLSATGTVGQRIALALREDGSATMSTGKENEGAPAERRGTWSAEGQQVVVTLTDRSGQAAEERLVFARADDGIALQDYDPVTYGERGLRLRRTSAY